MQRSCVLFLLAAAAGLSGACSNRANQTPPPRAGDRASLAEAEPEAAAEPDLTALPEPEADELAADQRDVGLPEGCAFDQEGRLLLSTVHFEFNEYGLTESTREALDIYAECLQARPELVMIVEGHCDERGTQEFNLALGNHRAHAVYRYLATLGIEEDRLRPVSKGKNIQLCYDSSESCWAKNRRVGFVPVEPDALASRD